LERFEDGRVTFRYRDGRTGTTKRCTLDAVRFIARFLQHVLPAGFSKVRHYGLFSPSRKPLLDQARAALLTPSSSAPPSDLPPIDSSPSATSDHPPLPRCPACGIGLLHLVETLPRWTPPP
ncbi:MAG: IS91 family transposase, partial [Candidatus Rokuibacteriota bacterium]